MDTIPQLRLIFVLTKNDSADFDRDAVTHRLGIMPSETSAPRLSKGKLNCDEADIDEVKADLDGITILPAASPPYQMILHASWCIELPKKEYWELKEPLQQLEELLRGKESEVLRVCKDYNLSASLTIVVYAESNSMPVLEIPSSSMAFWASIGVEIGFDFYLD